MIISNYVDSITVMCFWRWQAVGKSAKRRIRDEVELFIITPFWLNITTNLFINSSTSFWPRSFDTSKPLDVASEAHCYNDVVSITNDHWRRPYARNSQRTERSDGTLSFIPRPHSDNQQHSSTKIRVLSSTTAPNRMLGERVCALITVIST